MNKGVSLFALWGGVRKMARDVSRPASTVHGWKKEGRIPAAEQPHVLEIGLLKGLPITTEHLVFPLGRPDAALAPELATFPGAVARDRQAHSQRKDIA